MPHLKHGQVVNVGDEVVIRAAVKSVTTGEEYCNLTVETVEPMYPGDYKSSITINARQAEAPPTPGEPWPDVSGAKY